MKRSHGHWLSFLILTMALCVFLSACAHKHAYDEERVDRNATCTEDGSIVRTCACGAEDVEVIPAKGHTDGEWLTRKRPALRMAVSILCVRFATKR